MSEQRGEYIVEVIHSHSYREKVIGTVHKELIVWKKHWVYCPYCGMELPKMLKEALDPLEKLWK